MRQWVTVVTPPAVEPVTVADARLALGQEAGADAPVLDMHLRAARELAEAFTGRAFITTVLKLTLDQFPDTPSDVWWDGVRDGVLPERQAFILLPRPPAQAITSVVYTDSAGTTQTVPATSYYLAGERLMLTPGNSWPIGARRASIHVTFTAGYGLTPESVPAAIRAGILAHVRDTLERPNSAISSERIDNASVTYGAVRTGAAAGTGVESGGLRGGAVALLHPYRVVRTGL